MTKDQLEQAKREKWVLSIVTMVGGAAQVRFTRGQDVEKFWFNFRELSLLVGFRLQVNYTLSTPEKCLYVWLREQVPFAPEFCNRMLLHMLFEQPDCLYPERVLPTSSRRRFIHELVHMKGSGNVFYVYEHRFLQQAVCAIELDLVHAKIYKARWWPLSSIDGVVWDIDRAG
ncbi:hypothetical protein [Thalassotalea litorea]|uniref:hypothetical protein n=1 Tax=Thalassotalea litorea TaxID=2020715 RepID=UPI003736437A